MLIERGGNRVGIRARRGCAPPFTFPGVNSEGAPLAYCEERERIGKILRMPRISTHENGNDGLLLSPAGGKARVATCNLVKVGHDVKGKARERVEGVGIPAHGVIS
jgi:hypothetical protein